MGLTSGVKELDNFVKKTLRVLIYIVGLDQNNVKTIQQMGGKDIYKLGDFGFEGACVPDPYYFSGFEGFDKVYSMIESCVKELFDVKVTQTY